MKQNSCPKEISSIIDFVLQANKINSNWRILELDEFDWSVISREKSNIDKRSKEVLAEFERGVGDHIKELMNDLSTKKKLKEHFHLKKQNLTEYGVVPNHTDYLTSDAMFIGVKIFIAAAKSIFLTGLMISLAEQNSDVDGLILINSGRFSKLSYEEKLVALTHEALHLVEDQMDIRGSSFQSIEKMAKKLVHDFMKQHKIKRTDR